jgi:hypothetical protein
VEELRGGAGWPHIKKTINSLYSFVNIIEKTDKIQLISMGSQTWQYVYGREGQHWISSFFQVNAFNCFTLSPVLVADKKTKCVAGNE